MAGTMPHAIFIETNADGEGGCAAYAAELPGCAVFASTDDEAAAAMARRVERFGAWLRERGEVAPTFVGDNWYEVERAAAVADEGGLRRAAFTLDDLSPSDAEFAQYLGWLELAREELADALDAMDGPLPDAVRRIADQDEQFSRTLGGEPAAASDDPIDRLYAAREVLTDALAAAGPTADGVRRVFRLAIADDLELADRLRGVAG
jgi:hypothetical protein